MLSPAMSHVLRYAALAALLAACNRANDGAAAEENVTDTPEIKRTDLMTSDAPLVDFAMAPPRAVDSVEGLAVETLAEGDGDPIRYGMIGRFHYIGSLATGRIFRNTYDTEPQTLRLLPPAVAEGLALGADGMRVGERRRIEVPPSVGLSGRPQQMAGVPENARLSYDLELVEIVDSLEVRRVQEGEGEAIAPGQAGQFAYTGILAKNGVVFDSTPPGGATRLDLNNVVQGWQFGLPGMKVGETRWLKIPPELAYGERGSPPKIGANEPLVFEVELREITP